MAGNLASARQRGELIRSDGLTQDWQDPDPEVVERRQFRRFALFEFLVWQRQKFDFTWHLERVDDSMAINVISKAMAESRCAHLRNPMGNPQLP